MACARRPGCRARSAGPWRLGCGRDLRDGDVDQAGEFAPIDLEQRSDDAGIEMGPGLGGDLGQGPVKEPCLLVWACVGERVEDVGDRDDSAAERDRDSGQADTVAVAVPRLVVGAGDLLG